MGTEVGGSIRELCNQGYSIGSNDINKLALHKKMTKFACGRSASWKDFDDITSYYF